MNEWTPELKFEKHFRNIGKCDDTYSMPRENKLNIAKEGTGQWENIGSKVRQ